MRSMHRFMALAAVAMLAIAAAPLASAAAPQAREDGAKLVLSNDQVTVWFAGKAPSLSLANGTGATGALSYKFLQLVEFRDVDGNGAPGANEIIQTLALDGAGWTAQLAQSESQATINFTLNGTTELAAGNATPATPVPLPGGVPVVDRSAQVSLLFTVRGAASPVSLGTVNLTLPTSAVQQGFTVSKWPWLDAASDRLALVGEVGGTLARASAAGIDRAVVTSNGTAVGAVAWTTTAQATGDAGAQLLVPVRTTIENGTGNATRIVHEFDAPGVRTLGHASTLGLAGSADALVPGGAGALEAVKPAPAPGVVLAVGAVGVAALALRLRRK